MRIGVYVCHCGGNISDYVDVDRVAAEASADADVVVARTAMFTCSDATQREIEHDIAEQGLEGLVVASCSPKLHTSTFRDLARRAGLNPYQYTQVNIREQCSWAHTDDRDGATCKAIGLVGAGVARTARSIPLEPIVVDTVPAALVIGGGVAGLRAALGFAEVGIAVYLVERAPALGGWVGRRGETYPHSRNGGKMVATMIEALRAHPGVTVFTGAEVVSKSGSFGNYQVGIRTSTGDLTQASVGSIVVATGFSTYQPQLGEYGYGLPGVLTLPQFTELLDRTDGPLIHDGRTIGSVAYIYCVGSRQDPDVAGDGAHSYCSNYCCAATAHASIRVAVLPEGPATAVHQYHLYRDMRTYGRFELLFGQSRERGSVYLRIPDDEPPAVSVGEAGRITVTTRDLLAGGEEFPLQVDLVVLVTGMVARRNPELIATLKLPVGNDGFFNEIHPKLRPVDTVVDGVYIAGACQGPKNAAESVASGLAAVTQAAGILLKGHAQIDPLIVTVDAAACTGCEQCRGACPYDALVRVVRDGVEQVTVNEASCKGCGGCVPLCPENAIDLRGYGDRQVRDMISRRAAPVGAQRAPR